MNKFFTIAALAVMSFVAPVFANAGSVNGATVHSDRVLAETADNYTIAFRAGEQAMVIVSGDGDTDLDLYVYDQNGTLVAEDSDYSDDCVAVWTPAYTGKFNIKVVNRGCVYNNYKIGVN